MRVGLGQRKVHLLSSQRHHVQGAIHKATSHDLLAVLRQHRVVHPMVCSYILSIQKESNVHLRDTSHCFQGLCRRETYPNLHMSPLAEPFLSRFRRSEFRHLFPIELQDAGVFMPHHLRKGFPGYLGRVPGYRQFQKEKRVFKC